MHIERAIYLGTAVATLVLLFLALRWIKARRFGSAAATVAGVVLVHFLGNLAAGPSMRGYTYEASNDTFLEVPFKDVRYERMLEHYRDEGRGELFRTFEKDRWNYYRWYDYATHPRWKLPYRPETQNARRKA